ncbi:hypothetical protein [Psychroflexus sediminis]|nr:hypothetical protein [Psychroflexus sediminis]
MKALLHIFCILSLGFFMSTDNSADVHIKKGSQITISGKSNVNQFSCAYTTQIAEGGKNITYNYFSNVITLNKAEIKLKSDAFDCGGKMINKDFNELMQSEDYPNVGITLIQIAVKEKVYVVDAMIEIADEINVYSFVISPRQGDHYTGSLELNINDFDMEAPRKLLGAIKVDPNINIEFDLYLEVI